MAFRSRARIKILVAATGRQLVARYRPATGPAGLTGNLDSARNGTEGERRGQAVGPSHR
jgi:hypothetical protein